MTVSDHVQAVLEPCVGGAQRQPDDFEKQEEAIITKSASCVCPQAAGSASKTTQAEARKINVQLR